MTNTIALCLGVFIFAVFALDALIFSWGLPVILMRLLADLINWLAVWR